MLFNSFSFAIFFVIVTSVYFVLQPAEREKLGWRWAWLLGASCLFYMWFIPQYILILGLTITVDYFAGIYIERSQGVSRKRYLMISIVVTCLILFVFKYFNFFNSNFSALFHFLGSENPIKSIDIILPIGLSFHTFQSLSYIIEVYRGNQKAEKHFGIFALYVMFYPQLVAGPIERRQNLLHQFREKFLFDYERVTDGLKLMAWGLFKKVVIADRLAQVVTNVYGNPLNFNGVAFVIATIFFAFQIFCDFSGYSDIAVGSAKVMGFTLMENFNRPYFSKTISEFWTRWHISLSTWFKDYLYISLGGNRCSKFRWQLNLFLTFLLSGLWHGASWTYVIWGAINGFYLVFAIWTKEFRKQLFEDKLAHVAPTVFKVYQVSSTFMLICISWIFFRALNISDAFYIVSHLHVGWGTFLESVIHRGTGGLGLGVGIETLKTCIGLIVLLTIVQMFERKTNLVLQLKHLSTFPRWATYYLLVYGIIFWGVFKNTEFIYFQF